MVKTRSTDFMATLQNMKTDPTTSILAMSATALLNAHDALHDVMATTKSLGTAEIEVHHLIAEELRARGIGHLDSTDGLHEQAVTLSKVRLPISALSKMMSGAEVNAITQMAAANGTSFADVYELLTSNGWVLTAEPSMPQPDDQMEPMDNEENYVMLEARQQAIADGNDDIVEQFGKWDQSGQPNGAHYMPVNPLAKEGVICANCVSYEGGGSCNWVSGTIDPMAACKLWVIPTDRLTKERYRQPRARSGEWVDSSTAGAGVISTGQTVTPNGDAAKGGTMCDCNKPMVKDYMCETCGGFVPPNTSKADSYQPPKDVQAEAARALAWIREGHAGNGFTAVGQARARDLSNGRNTSVETLRRMSAYFTRHGSDNQAEGYSPGEKGYPSPGRVAWAAWGGDAGRRWADSTLARIDGAQKSLILKQVDERRFTLGPWYVPNTLDAHGEWTDSEELQSALWDYVKNGNREIRLQHTPETKAGDWVEAMTWPFPVEVPMLSPETGTITRKQFPAGTVFLGVQWEPWAWQMVKSGQIRGYSIGGTAERMDAEPMVYADVQQNGYGF